LFLIGKMGPASAKGKVVAGNKMGKKGSEHEGFTSLQRCLWGPRNNSL